MGSREKGLEGRVGNRRGETQIDQEIHIENQVDRCKQRQRLTHYQRERGREREAETERQMNRHRQTIGPGPFSYEIQTSIILLMMLLPVGFFLPLNFYDVSVFACVQTVEEDGSWEAEI